MATNEIGTILKVDIDQEMRGAYLDYAMSVIVARALPDVRDGLKPVHRRILYAMHSMGLRSDKPHRKSARIVGEVLGKFHPHGDSAVYDAMVRMAQDFSMRYPLVDGQGNFGSIDGDSAAAMRYTEARLASIAETMLTDIAKDTVDWSTNFDDTLMEPAVLPAALPNLLLNGSSGIAVGMATNIPPHNLGEIVDALAFIIDHYHAVDDITLEHLLQFVKGPDFPTGGIVYRYREDKNGHEDIVSKAYAGGRGRLIVQAKVHVEAMSRNRSRLVITELPYQTNKTRLIERIAELVRNGRIEGITDLRDESDRQGMRIAIELTRNVEPKSILETLYKYTPMQQTFGVNMLALVEGQPRLLSLKRMLLLYLDHRREIVRRRSEFDLTRARERAHILEGLLIALANLDEVIATIRRSPDTDTARTRLMKKFKLSQLQAQAILDMPLKRLSRLERDKLKTEHKELLAEIAYLEDLLAYPAKMLAVIKEELLALKEKYNDPRRTQIVDIHGVALTTGELLDDQDVLVMLTKKGLFFQQSLAGRRRGSLPRRVADAPIAMAAAPARDSVFLFTAAGQAVQQRIHQIPGEEGVHFSEITDLQSDDEIISMLALSAPGEEDHEDKNILLVTRAGRCKRISATELWSAAHTSPIVMNVDEGDSLVSAVLCDTNQDDILLVTRLGQSIRFPQNEVRVMGLPAGGVLGMKLSPGDEVVGAALCKSDHQVVLLTTSGYGVRTPVSKYPKQKRHGSGVVAMRLTKSHGAVEALAVVDEEYEMFLIARTGPMKVLRLDDLPVGNRGVRGRRVASLKDVIVQKLLALVIPKVKDGNDSASTPPPPPPPPPPPTRRTRTRKAVASPAKKTTMARKSPAVSPASPRSRGSKAKPGQKKPPATQKQPTSTAAESTRSSKTTTARKTAAATKKAATTAAPKSKRSSKTKAKKSATTATPKTSRKSASTSKSSSSSRSSRKSSTRPAPTPAKPSSLDAIKKNIRRKRK